jgi:hypothetical protein
MRACWAVPCEEAPGRVFFAVWVVFFPLVGFCVPIWFGLVVWHPVCTRSFNTPSPSRAAGLRANSLTHLANSCALNWLHGVCSGAGAPLHKRTPVAALRKMAIPAVDSDPIVQFDRSSRSVLVIARHEIA